MKPTAPEELQARAARWDDLTRWERAELGRAPRPLGWSYGEIRELIPVPKGTPSNWCRDIRLTDEQAAAIRERTGSQRGVPRDTQRKRREEIERIRAEARKEAAALATDPFWVGRNGHVLGGRGEDAYRTQRGELRSAGPPAVHSVGSVFS